MCSVKVGMRKESVFEAILKTPKSFSDEQKEELIEAKNTGHKTSRSASGENLVEWTGV